MTSERKIAANRINGRKSRGPRTPAGKACASRNALRHGLAAITHRNPAFSAEIERIAKAICGDASDPLRFEQAIKIAENELLLRCVRAQRVAVIERLQPKSPERDELAALCEAMPDLDRLVRYERRAWSRRKRAIREFIEAKSNLPPNSRFGRTNPTHAPMDLRR